MGLFDDIIKDIDDAEAMASDGKAKLRSEKTDAKLDYVVLPDGKGNYIIDPERCEEVGLDPEEAAKQYVELKFKDIAGEIGK